MSEPIFKTDAILAEVLEASPAFVGIQWLTNDKGYLQKSCVRDFKKAEKLIQEKRFQGWAMASEVPNTTMHAIIERVGGVPVHKDDTYVYFLKEFPCAEQLMQSPKV